jgi:hypothetical protein
MPPRWLVSSEAPDGRALLLLTADPRSGFQETPPPRPESPAPILKPSSVAFSLRVHRPASAPEEREPSASARWHRQPCHRFGHFFPCRNSTGLTNLQQDSHTKTRIRANYVFTMYDVCGNILPTRMQLLAGLAAVWSIKSIRFSGSLPARDSARSRSGFFNWVTEMRYGKWTIVEEGSLYVICECDCGTRKRLRRRNVVSGRSRSCRSCSGRDAAIRRRKSCAPRTQHPLYTIWRGMIGRCTLQSRKDFAIYGAQGVTVCDRWLSLDAFASDMGPRPSQRHTLDRIDSAKGYSPDNCRWATWEQQAANRRSTWQVDVDGHLLSIKAAAERLGISEQQCYVRIRSGSLNAVQGCVIT